MVRKLIIYIMEGMAAIWGMIGDYDFMIGYVYNYSCFGCLAKFVALFSARVFSCRNSPLLLGELV